LTPQIVAHPDRISDAIRPLPQGERWDAVPIQFSKSKTRKRS
jgi:hypothetical protein